MGNSNTSPKWKMAVTIGEKEGGDAHYSGKVIVHGSDGMYLSS
jgi:hypothetical protein